VTGVAPRAPESGSAAAANLRGGWTRAARGGSANTPRERDDSAQRAPPPTLLMCCQKVAFVCPTGAHPCQFFYVRAAQIGYKGAK